jgi:hypothetical protein
MHLPKSTHSTVPDLKVGVWMLNEAEALRPACRQAGLILSGTCIFPTLKGRLCVPPNVSKSIAFRVQTHNCMVSGK